MELQEANSNFGFTVIFTWVTGPTGYTHAAPRPGHQQGSFDYVAALGEPEGEPENVVSFS